MKEETKPSATKQAPQQRKLGVSVSIPKTQIFTELTKGKPYIVRSFGFDMTYIFSNIHISIYGVCGRCLRFTSS